jgi:hypothetical protein
MPRKNRIKVICDINVWYRLGQVGIGSTPELLNYDMYLSNLSLVELISSENLIKNFELVQRAFFAISKYSQGILSQNDAQLLILANKPDYIDELSVVQRDSIINILEIFLKAKNINEIDYEYKQIIINRDAEVKNWLSSVTDFIGELRTKSIKDLEVINQYVSDILINHMKEYLNRNSPQTIIGDLDFKKFELFIDCFSLYLLDFVQKSTKRFDKNDYIDFMNLLYCTDDFKYLTLETEKKNRLGKMLELSQYSKKYLLPDYQVIKNKLNKAY